MSYLLKTKPQSLQRQCSATPKVRKSSRCSWLQGAASAGGTVGGAAGDGSPSWVSSRMSDSSAAWAAIAAAMTLAFDCSDMRQPRVEVASVERRRHVVVGAFVLEDDRPREAHQRRL